MISGKNIKVVISDDMIKKLESISNNTNRKIELTDEQKKIIIMYYDKKNKTELAKLLNISVDTLRRYYYKLKRGEKI